MWYDLLNLYYFVHHFHWFDSSYFRQLHCSQLSFDFEFVVVVVAAAVVEDVQVVVVAVAGVALLAYHLQELRCDEGVLRRRCEAAVGASLLGEDKVDGSRSDSLTCPL
jgi:hypothetical protein